MDETVNDQISTFVTVSSTTQESPEILGVSSDRGVDLQTT